MTDDASEPLEPEIERTGRRWPSLVWLVPLIAVLGAVVLLVQGLANRGPLITIEFAAAEGLRVGESVVKYRDVDVGRVEAVRFSDDLSTVLVMVRMDQAVAPYLDGSAKFWIVRPQVSAQGITGLDTVISGTYIEGSWDTEPGSVLSTFVGDELPPPTPEGTPGIRVRLRAVDGGSLNVGSPVLFKRIEVGLIESKTLTEDGAAVEFSAFIRAPNDRRISDATRFWNTSGVDLQLGADGARLKIASLSSLLRGGVSFEDFGPGNGAPVEPGQIFELFTSESDASDNARVGDAASYVRLQINFSGSVRGLRPGATVEYGGIRVGRVIEVSAAVDPRTGRFRTNTIIGLSPTLLSFDENDREGLLGFIGNEVANGLRAKLAMGNLLTGALFVDLEPSEDAPIVSFDPTPPVPELPAVASDFDELAGSVEGILTRVDALPIEALLGNAVNLLENLNRLAGAEETQKIPGQALSVLATAEALVADPQLAQTAGEATALLKALRTVAEDPALVGAPEKLEGLLTSLSGLASELERAKTAGDLAATVKALRVLVESPATKRLPEQADAALASVSKLLEQPGWAAIPGEVNDTLSDLRGVLALPGLDKLPGDVRQTLASLQARLDDPALSQAIRDIGPLVADTRRAVNGIATKADPALTALSEILNDPGAKATPAALAATLTSARTFLEKTDFSALAGEATTTLAALRQVLDTPGARAAPTELAAALKSTQAFLKVLEEAEAAKNLSATLAAVEDLVGNPALITASNELSQTLVALRAVLSTEGAQELPAAAADALTSAAALLAQLERENLAGSAAGALDGVKSAGAAFERSIKDLPALLARLRALSARADSLLASVDVGSELNYEAVTAIREIRDAARAVTDLADLIQRKPNSIILGK